MAITVTWGQTPSEIATQILSPLIVKADSDETAEPKFKYQIRITINAVEVYRGLFAPNNAGVAQMDISDIILSYLSADNSTAFTQVGATQLNQPSGGNNIKFINVTVFEVFAASATAVPTTHADRTIERVFLWSRNIFTQPNGLNVKSLVPTGVTKGQFLTNRPRTFEQSVEDVLGLSFLFGNGTYTGTVFEADRIEINAYINGVLQVSETVLLVGSPVVPNSQANANTFLQTIQVGLANLDASDYDDIKPSLHPTYNEWRVQLLDNIGIVSEQFNIKKTCQTGKQFRFINSYGVWDYFTFRGAFLKKNVTSKQTFTKLKGNYQGSAYSYNQFERGLTTFNHTDQPSISVKSGYIDEATNNWLVELFQSPDVRLLEDGLEYPMVLESTDYFQKTAKFDGLIEIEANFLYANPKPLQR